MNFLQTLKNRKLNSILCIFSIFYLSLINPQSLYAQDNDQVQDTEDLVPLDFDDDIEQNTKNDSFSIDMSSIILEVSTDEKFQEDMINEVTKVFKSIPPEIQYIIFQKLDYNTLNKLVSPSLHSHGILKIFPRIEKVIFDTFEHHFVKKIEKIDYIIFNSYQKELLHKSKDQLLTYFKNLNDSKNLPKNQKFESPQDLINFKINFLKFLKKNYLTWEKLGGSLHKLKFSKKDILKIENLINRFLTTDERHRRYEEIISHLFIPSFILFFVLLFLVPIYIVQELSYPKSNIVLLRYLVGFGSFIYIAGNYAVNKYFNNQDFIKQKEKIKAVNDIKFIITNNFPGLDYFPDIFINKCFGLQANIEP